MTDKYNGWTNYATWRVNLEIFDGMDLDLDNYFVEDEEPDSYALAKTLEQIVEETLFEGYDERRPANLVENYARAFLQDVDYRDIAQHLLRDHAENLKG